MIRYLVSVRYCSPERPYYLSSFYPHLTRLHPYLAHGYVTELAPVSLIGENQSLRNGHFDRKLSQPEKSPIKVLLYVIIYLLDHISGGLCLSLLEPFQYRGGTQSQKGRHSTCRTWEGTTRFGRKKSPWHPTPICNFSHLRLNLESRYTERPYWLSHTSPTPIIFLVLFSFCKRVRLRIDDCRGKCLYYVFSISHSQWQ